MQAAHLQCFFVEWLDFRSPGQLRRGATAVALMGVVALFVGLLDHGSFDSRADTSVRGLVALAGWANLHVQVLDPHVLDTTAREICCSLTSGLKVRGGAEDDLYLRWSRWSKDGPTFRTFDRTRTLRPTGGTDLVTY